MRFESELIEGRLCRRYKRFLADIELPGGEVVVAHCPNPGSMKSCAPSGGRVWVQESRDPRRKLRYTWELVEASGAMVCVNTAHGNRLIAEALAAGAIPDLAGYDEIRREVRVPSPSGPAPSLPEAPSLADTSSPSAPAPSAVRSRLDFALTRKGERCFVEVKSVSLHAGGRVSAFPDAVTARGRRHLEELMSLAAGGDRAVLLFCCVRDPTERVVPADEIDPRYGEALRRAAAAGVELLAYACDVDTRGIAVSRRVPVDLERRTGG